MPNPNIAQGMPQGDAWLARKLEDMQRQINEMRAAQTLSAATVGTGGIVSQDFNGTLTPPTQGTAGWGLAGAGGVGIFNQLLLANGIIGDDALTNPVTVAYGRQDANTYALPVIGSFAYTGGGTTRASVSLTTPPGFTQMIVYATVTDDGVNTTGGNDTLYSFMTSTYSTASFYYAPSATVPPGFGGAAFRSIVDLYTGLTNGQVVRFDSKPGTFNGAWSSAASTGTALYVLALYLR